MLTIFTIPKPFTEQHINIIQRNAIQSWVSLSDCEIVLVGDDKGIKKIAQEFKIKHIPEVKRNEFGTPLLNSAFALVKKHSKNNLFCYINADIILLPNFSESIKILPEKNFLAVGRRTDLDISKEIDFPELEFSSAPSIFAVMATISASNFAVLGHKSAWRGLLCELIA